MNPPPKKPYIRKFFPRINLSQDYFIPRKSLFPDYFIQGNLFFPNTAPKFGDLWSLFYQPDNTSDSWLESGWKTAVGCIPATLLTTLWDRKGKLRSL